MLCHDLRLACCDVSAGRKNCFGSRQTADDPHMDKKVCVARLLNAWDPCSLPLFVHHGKYKHPNARAHTHTSTHAHAHARRNIHKSNNAHQRKKRQRKRENTHACTSSYPTVIVTRCRDIGGLPDQATELTGRSPGRGIRRRGRCGPGCRW